LGFEKVPLYKALSVLLEAFHAKPQDVGLAGGGVGAGGGAFISAGGVLILWLFCYDL
jgi:hypothetical protein